MNWLQRAAIKLLNLDVKRAQTPVVSSSLNTGVEIYSDWQGERATQEGMKRSVWVYGCVDKISTLISSVPLQLERKKGDMWEPMPDHPLQALLNMPNDFMTASEISERWSQHMLLSGNCIFWLNTSPEGKVLEIWPIQPDQIKPIRCKKEFISGYRWLSPDGVPVTFSVNEVVHWQFPDPNEPRWGLSPLQAAAEAVDMDLAAVRWNRKVLLNDGKPPIAIMLSDKLTIDQLQDSTALIHNQIERNGVRRALVVGGATEVKPLSLNAAELDFLEGRKFSKEEIASVFGVPPVLLTVGEGATYANLDAAKQILWEDKALPMLRVFCTGWELSLFDFFDLDTQNYRIVPNLTEIRALQGNLEVEAKTLKTKSETFALLVNAGVDAGTAGEITGLPIDEITKPAVAPPPKDDESDEDTEEEDESEDDEDEKKSLILKSLRATRQRRDLWVEEAKARVADLLIDQGNSIAAAYTLGTPWRRELRSAEWRELMQAIYQVIFESEGARQYSELLDAIRTEGAGSFDVLADNVVEWIETNAAAKIKQIEQTTRSLVAAEIAAGVEAGEGATKIAQRISNLHEDWADWRALRIARTEVNGAFGEAHQLSAEQFADNFDVNLVKIWRSLEDKAVRDEHYKMDGEKVGLKEVFSNGLRVPNEPNCRCIVMYEEE